MVLTDFKLTSGTGILKSGVCIKACPTEKDIEFKDGENCKSNDKVTCDGKKSYITKDVFDFCLPVSSEAFTATEK